MTIQELGAIGELIGGIAIIISLLYVGLQIRQHSSTLRSTTAQSATEMAESVYVPVMQDATLADLTIRGLKDPSTLSEVDMARFTSHWQNGFFTLQNWFYQWRAGTLDDDIWGGWSQVFTDIYTTPGIKYFWDKRCQYFSKEFRDYLEKDLFLKESTPGYRILAIPEE
jgi:hypothetical protein